MTATLTAPLTAIAQDDLIQSVADALQYISYYHPVDYIKNLAAAYEREQSPAAKDSGAEQAAPPQMSAGQNMAAAPAPAYARRVTDGEGAGA